jgi:hypothetical protein
VTAPAAEELAIACLYAAKTPETDPLATELAVVCLWADRTPVTLPALWMVVVAVTIRAELAATDADALADRVASEIVAASM